MAVSILVSYLYERTVVETAGLAIFSGIGIGCVIFAMEQSREAESYLFDNSFFLWRFTLLYLISLGGSILFPLLPVGGWPYLAVFVGLMLFSNQVIGLSAGTVLLFITVLLCRQEGSDLFFTYFIIGLVGVLIFSYINEAFKVWLPILISLMFQMVCLSVQEVLLVNEVLNLQMFVIPAVNTLVCLLLLLIILKFFSFSIIYKNRDLYMEINDPECELLVELKTFSREEYYHAVHTAYLCDRIAKRLGMDDPTVKACGYYHRIGVLKGEVNWESTEAILQEYDFPERVMEVLKEYISQEEKILSKETVVLLFSDTIISSISYLFSKDPKAELDYTKLINTVFKQKAESIDDSNMTLGEIKEMQKILVEERLYYDFLR